MTIRGYLAIQNCQAAQNYLNVQSAQGVQPVQARPERPLSASPSGSRRRTTNSSSNSAGNWRYRASPASQIALQ